MPLRDRIFDAGRRAASFALERATEFVAPEPEFDPGSLDIAKAEGASAIPSEAPTDDPSALFFDPYILIQQMGYKDKPTMMSYGMLSAIVTRIPIVRAIIQTRLSQVSAFARPPQDIHQTGFKIRPKDKDAKLSPADRKFQQKMTDLMLCSGVRVNGQRRDGFEHFLKKFVRDSLFYDQACAVAGTPVQLASGEVVNIEDIEAGMMVLTHRGRARPVVHPTERLFSGKLVEFKTRAQKLEVTEGHPLFVAKKTSLRGNTIELSEPEWIPAGDLTTEDYLAYPIPKLEEGDIWLPIFDEKPRRYPTGDLGEVAKAANVHKGTAYQVLTGIYKKNGPAKARVLKEAERLGVSYEIVRRHEPSTRIDEQWSRIIGFYLAEGCCAHGMVRFTFNSAEESYVEEIVAFGARYGISNTRVDYEDRDGIDIILSSTALEKFFRAYFSTGSANKKLPDFVYKMHRSCRRRLLSGYLDGDGYLRSGQCSVGTVSRRLFSGIRILLASEKIYMSEVVEDRSHRGWSTYYCGNLSGPHYRAFAKEQGLPHVDRPEGARKYIVAGDWMFVRPSRISYRDVVDHQVFNMEVEEDHSYVASGVVNHNCYEIVKNRRGLPAAWFAVDGSTIRLSDNYKGFVETDPEAIRYVQVYNQVVINEWKDEDMAFMIRNPATNIWNQGYGEVEGEMLVKTMTQLLWSDEYNSRIFSQGTMVKGLVNIKGTINQKLLRAFRREWLQMISGVSNAFRSPVLNAEEIQYIPLDKSNKDMEFSAYYDFLLKITCAVMLMDPSEVNFKFGDSGPQKSMFESGNKQKLVESKDKGLKPILRSVARSINDNIIERIDDEWELIFYGLEAHTPSELADLNTKRGKSTHTVNELREEQGKEPLPDGDVILDPTFIQYKMAKEAMEAGVAGQLTPGEQGAPDQETEAPTEEELASLLEAAEEEGDEEAAKSLAKSFKLDIAV